MNSNGGPVVIVGGGVIGAMSAWYLSQAGHDVTILERDRFGAACSHGNCGYISPSHVLPLTQPGAIRGALSSIFKGPSRSPVYVKPRFSPALIKWLWRFSRRCNKRDMLQAAASLNELLQSSADLYAELIESQKIQCEWTRVGLLNVFQTAAAFEHFEESNTLVRENFGVGAVPWDSKTLEQKEPALKPGLAGAWYFDCDSHIRPDKLMSEMRARLETAGVRIVENCNVTGFVKEGQRARAAQTNRGEIAGNRFVVAAGALTPFLNNALGCNIPIQPGKGYSITMPRPEICPTYPLIFEEHRVAITPMQSAYRIGSTMEFAGYDRSVNPKRLEYLTVSAKLYLKQATAEPVIERWYGWRPMTWDSLPIIDRIPSINNGWVAAGHNMLGLSLGAVTGKLVSEMVGNETPHLDIRPLSVARMQ